MTAQASYDIGMSVRIPGSAPPGQFVWSVAWFPDANCTSTAVGQSFPGSVTFQSSGGVWQKPHGTAIAPAGAVGAVFQIDVTNFSNSQVIDIDIDRVYLTPTPGGF